MTPDGVLVPLALTHETLGRLVGAERPTVSLALKELAESGDLRQARPLAVARTPDAPALPELPRPTFDLEALRQRVAVLQEQVSELEHARAERDTPRTS